MHAEMGVCVLLGYASRIQPQACFGAFRALQREECFLKAASSPC